MKRQITFVLAALFAAAALSFGCSDSGDSGGGGEIPDVSGNYTVKTSTCPFTSDGGTFSVTQSTSNREMLAISLGYVVYDTMESLKTGKAESPDFYEVPSVPSGTAKKASIMSANVSAGGGLTAQIKYGEATYDCSGTFKKDGDTKKTDFNCNTGSTSCSFSAEGTAATPGPTPPPPTPGEGEENGPCKHDIGCVSEGMGCWSVASCNAGLVCNEEKNICEKPVTPLVKGEENGACNDDGTCNKAELTCTDNVCAKKSPLTCSEGVACPSGAECKEGLCVNIPTPGTKKFGDVCVATSECGANLLCTDSKCVWDPNFVIQFADDKLRKAIAVALSKPESTQITVADCNSLPDGKLEYHPAYSDQNGCQDLPALKISSLEGLQYCTGIKELTLYCNTISDIKPLSGLTGLTSLYLYNNQISDITPLSGLTGLTWLNLGYQRDKDGKAILAEIMPLANLGPKDGKTGLTTLYLYNNQISDITPLSGLTGLTTLNLDSNQISNIKPLAGLTGLTTLYLYNNQISDLKPLAGLTGLTWLDLANQRDKDGKAILGNAEIMPLANLGPKDGKTGLKTLYLYNNQISDITPLSGLTGLTWLNLGVNQIKDINSLKSMTQLSYLNLVDNPIYMLGPLSDIHKNGGLPKGSTLYINKYAPLQINIQILNYLAKEGVIIKKS